MPSTVRRCATLSAHAVDPSQRRLRERRRADPARQRRADLALPQVDSRTSWAALAAAGAIVLLVIAALGPVPGLAHPPAVEAAGRKREALSGWLDPGALTLHFERDGLRTMVQYTGPQIGTDTLTAAATMLVAPPPGAG